MAPPALKTPTSKPKDNSSLIFIRHLTSWNLSFDPEDMTGGLSRQSSLTCLPLFLVQSKVCTQDLLLKLLGGAVVDPVVATFFPAQFGRKFLPGADSLAAAPNRSAKAYLRRKLTALEGLKFFERPRPVRPQKPGQTAIGKDFSAGLASGAVIRFVVRIANPKNFLSAPRTRLSVAAVNRHAFAKRGHLFGKGGFRLRAQPVDPEPQGLARRREQSFRFLRLQLMRERDGRKLGRVQDLIGIRVADAAQQARIGKSSLQRAIFDRERGAERGEMTREDVNSPGIDGAQAFLAAEDMQRCAALGAGFGKHERTAGKIEGHKILPARKLGLRRPPVQP